jgi:hypothetical protein
MVAPQPVSLRPFYERITEILGIADRIDDIDREIQLITSFTMDQMSPIGYAKNVRVPTFIIQAHDDALTKPSDGSKSSITFRSMTRSCSGLSRWCAHPGFGENEEPVDTVTAPRPPDGLCHCPSDRRMQCVEEGSEGEMTR